MSPSGRFSKSGVMWLAGFGAASDWTTELFVAPFTGANKRQSGDNH